ncbi:beta-glucosidase [Fusarium beomiforme]|uniref:beta-glucosidase n=1 Tax=Fusarium beomiforme TaxID=44412 RepID=A0A9P5AEE3_9HYPO|nr:beta-glucosidase [Fusarium beomiforme]
MESGTVPILEYRQQPPDREITQPLTFDGALKEIENGQDVSTVAVRLLAELSFAERLHLLDGDVPFWDGLRAILCDRYNRRPFVMGAIPRLNIPGIRFTDGPRGVVMGSSTAFPISMARGATWDIHLERRVGNAIGLEGKAQGANFFAGVCINLPRHPAWGRIQETYGEDPILLGEFGAALTQGVQNHIMACVKHFALNSIENARFRVDVQVEEDVLHEVYLAHFRRVIEAGAASVMSSYNSVNGEWAGQSKLLLTDILRNQWEFTGCVISDFIFGLRNAALSVKNGLDIEAPFAQQRAMHLKHALSSGELAWADINKAATNILRTQLDFGSRIVLEAPEASVVFCKEHRQLAREVAGRSMVLLKNDTINGNPLLPLKEETISRLAVVGRLANKPNTGDKGSSQVFSPTIVTPYQGLQNGIPNAVVILEDSDNPDAAREAAQQADVAVVIVGYDATDEGEYVVPSLQNDPCLSELFPPTKNPDEEEMLSILQGNTTQGKQESALEVGAGGDRLSLRLRRQDVEVVNAVASINSNIIVVIICAGAVIMDEWKDNAPAIMISWYAGAEGGHALADVLLGRVDAGGRLPFSIPKDERHLPELDIEVSNVKYDRWYGQALLDKLGVDAAFPLGYGLSYTKFRFSNLDCVHLTGRSIVKATVDMENTGLRSGHHVAQVYGYPEMAEFPHRVLLGFASIYLQAGESKRIFIDASLRPIERWVNGQFCLLVDSLEIEVAEYAGDKQAIRKVCKL